jgi:hypothetical protein
MAVHACLPDILGVFVFLGRSMGLAEPSVKPLGKDQLHWL